MRVASQFVSTIVVLTALAFAAPACTASQAFIVSGETLDTVGQQFVVVGQSMRAGLAAGKVSSDDFKKWAAFAEKFDFSYGAAVDAWKAAQQVRDAAAEKKWAVVLAELATELTKFYQSLKAANLLPAGAP